MSRTTSQTLSVNNHQIPTEDMLQLRKKYPTGGENWRVSDSGQENFWYTLHITNTVNRLRVNWFAADPKVCKDMFAAEKLRTQMKSDAAKMGWENRRLRLKEMVQ